MTKFFFTLLLSTQLFAATVPQDLVNAYLIIQHALAADQMQEAQDTSATLASIVVTYLATETITETEKTLSLKIKSGTEAITAANEEVGIRKGFEMISEGLVELVKLQPAIQPTLQLFYCPMAPGYRYWIQVKGESILNPYFGHKMLKCGSKKPW